MFKNFVPSTNKIYQWDFPKAAVLKRSMKGAMTVFFSRAHQQRVSKNDNG